MAGKGSRVFGPVTILIGPFDFVNKLYFVVVWQMEDSSSGS
jgi:hypothetical protein